MGSLVDYDVHYRKGPGQCGAPFAAFVEFFETYPWTGAKVLDLGCGQGRDALLAAGFGHRVLGVDLSEIGVAQMRAEARARDLDVRGVVRDVLEFRSRERFDVVILDRVLHLLLGDAQRRRCLALAAGLTNRTGNILIADTARHQPLIRSFFETCRKSFVHEAVAKSTLFARRIAP